MKEAKSDLTSFYLKPMDLNSPLFILKEKKGRSFWILINCRIHMEKTGLRNTTQANSFGFTVIAYIFI